MLGAKIGEYIQLSNEIAEYTQLIYDLLIDYIMSIKEKIQQYIDYKGISVYRLEADAGVSKGYWSKTKSISADVAMKISGVYTDISAEWLLRGEGDMIKGDFVSDINKPIDVGTTASSSFYERTIERKEKKIEELTLMVGRLQHEVEMLQQDKKTALEKADVLDAVENLKPTGTGVL